MMKSVQQYFPFPPAVVWDALQDDRAWWDPLEEPMIFEVGRRFEVTTLPPLFTQYNGRSEYRIVEVVPHSRLAVQFFMYKHAKPPTEWTRIADFAICAGGTQLSLSIVGVNIAERDDRILLHAVENIQLQTLHKLSAICTDLNETRPWSRNA